MLPQGQRCRDTNARIARYPIRTQLHFGVVGAAVVHGPSSASACRAKKQSLNKYITKKIGLDEAQHWTAYKSGRGGGAGSPTEGGALKSRIRLSRPCLTYIPHARQT